MRINDPPPHLFGELSPAPKGLLEKDLMASVCLGCFRNLIHTDTTDTSVWIAPPKPIKKQTLCQYPPDEAWTLNRGLRWKRGSREGLLINLCSKSVHRKEAQVPAQPTYTCPPRQSPKDSCLTQLSLDAVCWKGVVEWFVRSCYCLCATL